MPKYFTLKELCLSNVATARKIDNFPTFEIANHLQQLAEQILDPLRISWGGPINVTSGYRCKALNTAIGGAVRSAHMEGYAADLQPGNGKTEDFINFSRTWVKVNRIKFDQFIREEDKKTGAVWLHIGLYGPGGCQRGQELNLFK